MENLERIATEWGRQGGENVTDNFSRIERLKCFEVWVTGKQMILTINLLLHQQWMQLTKFLQLAQ